ncbi:hypothetical protein BD309DRAFT_945188 [Dichomitus squalens]|uniref:Uncharacterized protein n=1 Tax=Dichomitus squalens TaxID=114155 RepID=A0A4Q9Q2R8_9APHY|nr:hypothetical protein BD309DRAFT_945188 [Dichomitus squalens]TBU61281.1 hypothetical protein BD310DRAFT_921110 [Dichomitus squalens]
MISRTPSSQTCVSAFTHYNERRNTGFIASGVLGLLIAALIFHMLLWPRRLTRASTGPTPNILRDDRAWSPWGHHLALKD